MTIRELNEKKLRLQEELATVEAEILAESSMTDEVRLADELHSLLCRLAHEDQCSWYYEKWGQEFGRYSARRDYLAKAEKLMAMAPEWNNDAILSFVKAALR